MNMSKEEYLFMEWIILGKGITEEQYRNLTEEEFDNLKTEYALFVSKLK